MYYSRQLTFYWAWNNAKLQLLASGQTLSSLRETWRMASSNNGGGAFARSLRPWMEGGLGAFGRVKLLLGRYGEIPNVV